MGPVTDVDKLVYIITKSVVPLRCACDANNSIFLSLDEPENPASEAFRLNSNAAEATRLIVAAAFQPTLAVLLPAGSILGLISGGAPHTLEARHDQGGLTISLSIP